MSPSNVFADNLLPPNANFKLDDIFSKNLVQNEDII